MLNPQLRPATMEDSALLLRWRNDPAAVMASKTEHAVTEAEHSIWFAKAMSDEQTHLYILEDDVRTEAWQPVNVQPIGVGRLMGISNYQAVVSYSVDAAYRGKGYGEALLWALFDKAEALGYKRLRAEARLSNTASIHALLAARFAFSSVEFLTLEKDL